MAKSKTASPAKGTWIDKISDLFGDVDKNLDQVKKSIHDDLSKLKKEKEFESLAANLYLSAEEGFKKDLEELGITSEEDQKAYLESFKQSWQKQEMGKKSAEILDSPELAAMDDFITNAENLPEVKKIIESAEPQSKWQALLAGFASQIPGLDKYVNEYFGPVLSSIGLGFLVKPKKSDEKKDKGKKKTDEGKASGKKDAAKKDKKKGGKPSAKKESKEVRKTPKSTIFFGDSNTVGMTARGKDILKIDGKIKSVALGGESAKWGRDQVKAMADQKPSPLKNYENAVILFGSNDLLAYSPKKVIEFLKESYRILKKAGVKRVYAVTIPPVKGWAGYDRAKDRSYPNRREINNWIRGSKDAGLSHHVIDLAAKESKGGMADDGDTDKLSKKTKSADGLHFDKKLLATIYQRELEIGSGKAA